MANYWQYEAIVHIKNYPFEYYVKRKTKLEDFLKASKDDIGVSASLRGIVKVTSGMGEPYNL